MNKSSPKTISKSRNIRKRMSSIVRKRVVYVLVQVSCTALLYNSMSCSDDVYVGGYNKNLEHIDSTFYEKSRKINTGHE